MVGEQSALVHGTLHRGRYLVRHVAREVMHRMVH